MTNIRQNSDYNLLRKTIKKKHTMVARYLIRRNANVNTPRSTGNTPLHWAVIKYEDVELMTMLLDKGANIHAKNHHNDKPLDIAIRNNKTEAALLLIRRGALVGEDLNSSLLMAIETNNNTIVKMLIDHGIQNNPLIDLKISLNAAIFEGLSNIVKHILPHCRFLKPSDQYIPKTIVMKSDSQYKECVELLLKWNFTVHPNSKNDKNFIYTVVQKGYLPLVLQLLELGIDVNMMNSDTGLNLLKVACLHMHHEIVENLLKHNARVNVTTPTDYEMLDFELSEYNNILGYNRPLSSIDDTNYLRNVTCLHIAVLNSDTVITELLLTYGASIIDDPTFFKITCIAVDKNCEEIVRMFLDCGVNVQDTDSKGMTLLHRCFCNDNSMSNICELLLEKGATIHIQTPGNSLLMEAMDYYNHDSAQLFLDYNADIGYISPDGDTSLHVALKNYFDVEFIESLLKRNSPVNAINNQMLTPLLIACKVKLNHQLEIIKVLLDYNADVNCTDESLMTPLHIACQNQDLEIAAALLEKGANPNAENNKGQTPFHLACEQQYTLSMNGKIKMDNFMTPRIIKLLLKHKANIEAVDGKGWTPLFIACKTSNNQALQLLLNKHANINHRDFKNLTSLYIAAKNCKEKHEIVKMLLKHKVNVHCMDKRGNSVIHLIAKTEFAELIKYLARTQINFNSINKRGNSPLHIAVRKESVEMIKRLIKYGANINILDKKNQTPLKAAIEHMFDYRNKCDDYQWGLSSGDSDDERQNIKTYEGHIHQYKKIIKMLKIQVVKLRAAGLKVNNQNLDIVNNSDFNETSDDESSDDNFFDSDDRYNPYHKYVKINILKLEVKCEREVEKMRMKSTGINNITFYDLLTKNIHFLSRFVKNKKIRQTLKLRVNDKKFPLYMDIIRNRFRDAKFRYRMMNTARQYFISNITQRLSDNCIDTVFSYLNIKELKMFIRAMKPLDG